MLSLWVFMRNLAPIIGGAIIFGLNHDTDSQGGVSLQTYLAIIGIMCAGPLIALLISSPDKVQRKDGVKIHLRKVTLKQCLKEWLVVISSRDLLLLCPLFFTSWFYGSYIGTLQTQFFTIRTRALCALTIPFFDVLGGYAVGYFLDYQRLSIKQRARWSFVVLMIANLALWVWTAIITKQLEDAQPVIDWTSGSFFGRTYVLYLFFDAVTMATQTSLYWIIGHMSDDFIALSYMTGLLRGVECVGQAVAYGIKSNDTNDWISVGFNIGCFVISIPFSWAVIRKVGVQEFPKFSFHADETESIEGEKEKVAEEKA